MLIVYVLLITASLLTVSGEVLLKLGIDRVGGFEVSIPGFIRTFTEWRVFFGFVLVFGGALFWLAVISRVDLSFAYPLLAMNYLFVLIPSHYILGESIGPNRILGAVVVVIGVVILTWGSASQ